MEKTTDMRTYMDTPRKFETLLTTFMSEHRYRSKAHALEFLAIERLKDWAVQNGLEVPRPQQPAA